MPIHYLQISVEIGQIDVWCRYSFADRDLRRYLDMYLVPKTRLNNMIQQRRTAFDHNRVNTPSREIL